MKSSAEIFLDYIESIFNKTASVYKGRNTNDGIVTPSVFVFNDIPEKGFLTCVTYGLSLSGHPKWTQKRRPELILTVKSGDLQWAFWVVDTVSELRGKFPFSYGQRINFGKPVVAGSVMSGFLFFAPAILKPEKYLDIEVNEQYKICLTGIYPVSDKEMKMIDKIGFEKFWKNDEFDIFDVNRE